MAAETNLSVFMASLGYRRINMDARELTKKYYDLNNQIIELSKKVEFLEQENSKLRMQVDDLKIDVKMLQKR